ncbi:MAG TPA: CoA-acylating methylmalonate-semialdehyde dehydrogenase [Solirubrobacteraceae bacterium]|jgi:malonate-semialdehyde dehydrogenase (acetylating)/methylmalonate-semialdehyde dehydrogenase|nr:CoA-acylating methylmalonate-semialdehyde dehydrogenase [Solirubrobacteraceae bacterium]
MGRQDTAASATPTADRAPLAQIGHWIDGAPFARESARSAEVFDPARGAPSGRVLLADAGTVGLAVQAAARAFPSWRETPLPRRARAMFSFREALIARTEELAGAIAGEHGKTLDDARGEIQRGLEMVELACGASSILKGEHSEQVAGGVDVYSVRQPLGVCAGVTPFNFPAMVPLWMIPIALVCGNTFVLKPSERDPSASLLLAEMAAQAGVPPGVLNVVQGDALAVDALLDHPDVEAISFVGSTPIARQIYAKAARAGKRVQALGGAKNHMVVLPDADLAQAADAAVSAAFGSAGQRCMAVSVLVAVGEIADELVRAVAQRAAALRVGPACEQGSEMGPLISPQAAQRVRDCIERGVAAGATLVADGRQVCVPGFEHGFFVGPTIFDHVRQDMEIYEQEVFGPLLSVIRVGTLDQAIELINRNPYGNGAAIFTAGGGAARRFQHEVKAGMVGINVAIPVPVGFYSFGGFGDSLFGDTHVYGPEGFRFYTRGKVSTSRWPSREQTGVRLAFPND